MAIQARPSKNPEFKTWTHDLIIISNMHRSTHVCGANTLSDGRGMTRHLVNTNWCDVIDMTWSLPQWDWNWNHTFMGTGDTIPAAVGCNPCARLSPVLLLPMSKGISNNYIQLLHVCTLMNIDVMNYEDASGCEFHTHPMAFPLWPVALTPEEDINERENTRLKTAPQNSKRWMLAKWQVSSIFRGELDDCMMSLWRDKSYAVFIYFHSYSSLSFTRQISTIIHYLYRTVIQVTKWTSLAMLALWMVRTVLPSSLQLFICYGWLRKFVQRGFQYHKFVKTRQEQTKRFLTCKKPSGPCL